MMADTIELEQGENSFGFGITAKSSQLGRGSSGNSLEQFKRKYDKSRSSTNTVRPRNSFIDEMTQAMLGGDYGRPGWNGYEAEPLELMSIAYASTFLKNLPSSISLPTLDPNPNGLLGLYWKNGDYQLLLDINNNGVVSFAFKSKSGISYTGRLPFQGQSPHTLLELLHKYFS